VGEREHVLLQAAGRGDRQAFAELVTLTAPRLWQLVRRLTPDDRVAEDALQETLLGAWRSASHYSDEGSAMGWLCGVARRHAARSWRRRAGEPARAESLDALGELAGWGQDPEISASRAEDRAALLAALATLSDPDQEVIVYCDLEGMSAGEVGELSGLTANAVRVRLHRARLRLMAALREGGRDE
jgi:RNA polymerase sigma-70 factor (ECF subfamily)